MNTQLQAYYLNEMHSLCLPVVTRCQLNKQCIMIQSEILLEGRRNTSLIEHLHLLPDQGNQLTLNWNYLNPVIQLKKNTQKVKQ